MFCTDVLHLSQHAFTKQKISLHQLLWIQPAGSANAFTKQKINEFSQEDQPSCIHHHLFVVCCFLLSFGCQISALN